MISKRTLNHLIWSFKLASWLQVTSFEWNTQTQALMLKSDKLNTNRSKLERALRKSIRVFNVVYRVAVIIFISLNLTLRNDVIAPEVMLGMYFVTLFCATLPITILLLIWDTQIVYYVNSLLLFNSKFQQLHQSDIDSKDGLETLSILIFAIPIFTTTSTFPLVLFFIRDGPFYRFFTYESEPLLSVIFLLTFLLPLFVDTCCAQLVGLLLLIQINSFTKWITVCTNQLSEAGLSSQIKGKILLLYRLMDVVHRLANDTVSFVLPTIIPATEGLIIASGFGAIRLLRSSSFLLVLILALVAVGVLVMGILSLCMTLAVNVTEASKYFIHVAHGINFKRSKYLKRYLISCRPLTFNIGGTFTIQRDTLSRIANDIIIDILINLLILF